MRHPLNGVYKLNIVSHRGAEKEAVIGCSAGIFISRMVQADGLESSPPAEYSPGNSYT